MRVVAARAQFDRRVDERFIERLVALVTQFRGLSLENSLLLC